MPQPFDNKPLTLNNSPIEFIVVGPHKGKDTILVRSSNSGLDLTGLVNYNSEIIKSISKPSSLFSIFNTDRQLNVVESQKSFDLKTSIDDRKSSYRFAWVGQGNNKDRERIERKFNSIIYLVRQGLVVGDYEEVELTISSLILDCSLINQKNLRLKRMTKFMFLLYFVGVIFILIYKFISG